MPRGAANTAGALDVRTVTTRLPSDIKVAATLLPHQH